MPRLLLAKQALAQCANCLHQVYTTESPHLCEFEHLPILHLTTHCVPRPSHQAIISPYRHWLIAPQFLLLWMHSPPPQVAYHQRYISQINTHQWLRFARLHLQSCLNPNNVPHRDTNYHGQNHATLYAMQLLPPFGFPCSPLYRHGNLVYKHLHHICHTALGAPFPPHTKNFGQSFAHNVQNAILLPTLLYVGRQ